VATLLSVGELGDGPLGALSHLGSELESATDIDALARSVLRDLHALPGVSRVGLALTEGGGRRLRFLITDSGAWCHIDAYDDVPLTRVVRTGEPVIGGLDELGGRFAELVARQREAGTRGLAALPLPGPSAPIGGLIVYFDQDQAFDGPQLRLLEATARRTSQAVRRVRRLDAADQAHASGGSEDDHPHRASVRLEGDPRAAREARRFLRDLLATWQVGDDVVDSAELCLSELVTNAVVHAGTSSVLTVALEDDLLTVAVRDRGAGDTPELVEDEDPLKVFGRGLQLVDALSDRWGTERDEAGTVSWFALRVGTAA
jgi:anti-sigma regulatory factor (Ser/Thr protein kinase)